MNNEQLHAHADEFMRKLQSRGGSPEDLLVCACNFLSAFAGTEPRMKGELADFKEDLLLLLRKYSLIR